MNTYVPGISIQDLPPFQNIAFPCDPGINLVIGPNNIGKTTLLSHLRNHLFNLTRPVPPTNRRTPIAIPDFNPTEPLPILHIPAVHPMPDYRPLPTATESDFPILLLDTFPGSRINPEMISCALRHIATRHDRPTDWQDQLNRKIRQCLDRIMPEHEPTLRNFPDAGTLPTNPGSQWLTLWLFAFTLKTAFHYNWSPEWDRQPAILLLHEPEYQLYPAFSTKILPVLREQFPNTQIFATTYAPEITLLPGSGRIHQLRRNPDRSVTITTSAITPSSYTDIFSVMMGFTPEAIAEFHRLIDRTTE